MRSGRPWRIERGEGPVVCGAFGGEMHGTARPMPLSPPVIRQCLPWSLRAPT